jgi:glycerophosphoryl diester phosphodiesterase
MRTGFPYLDVILDEDDGSTRRVLAFAHRGGAFHPELEGLENTLAAFRHAVDLGYRYLEADAHATRDGVLLAFHDAVLDRVTGHQGSVAELTRADVSAALIGGRDQIPTMAALLEEFPDARFNIDLKSDRAVAPLAALVHATGAYDRVCVGSFSTRRIRRFRRLVGARVATAADPVEVAAYRFGPASLTGLLRRSPAAALQVPRRHRGVPVLTPRLVERVHAAGKHVHVWTVDDPAEMQELIDLGVDGIFTDRTDLLREVLVARGLWDGARR